jgi:hypothetical protein
MIVSRRWCGALHVSLRVSECARVVVLREWPSLHVDRLPHTRMTVAQRNVRTRVTASSTRARRKPTQPHESARHAMTHLRRACAVGQSTRVHARVADDAITRVHSGTTVHSFRHVFIVVVLLLSCQCSRACWCRCPAVVSSSSRVMSRWMRTSFRLNCSQRNRR